MYDNDTDVAYLEGWYDAYFWEGYWNPYYRFSSMYWSYMEGYNDCEECYG